MASKATTDKQDSNTNHQSVCDAVRDAGLNVFVFYASEPYVAVTNDNWRDGSDTIAFVEYASDKVGYVSEGFGVSTTQLCDPHKTDWEMPADPEQEFDRLEDAVDYAASRF
jgi:hypothetical protein